MVALCPIMWIRALFFTTLLGCFLVEPEEHTLMKFILGLKSSQVMTPPLTLPSLHPRPQVVAGDRPTSHLASLLPLSLSSQSIVGIYLAVAGLVGYYECAVVADPYAAPHALELDTSTIRPISSSPHLPWYSLVRAPRLSRPSCEAGGAPGVRDTWVGDALAVFWLQLLVWCAFAMLPHAVHLKSSPAAAASAAHAATATATGAASASSPSHPPDLPASPPPSPPNTNGYEQLSDQISDRGSVRDNEEPPAAAPDAAEPAAASAAPSAALHAGRAGGAKRDCERTVSGLFAHGTAPSSSSAPTKSSPSRATKQPTPHPHHHPPQRRSRNHRFVALVKWDLACFTFCLALFAVAVARKAGVQAFVGRSTEMWTDWRAAAAFFVCIRVLFAFTAFPFMLFEVPGFAQVMTISSIPSHPPSPLR